MKATFYEPDPAKLVANYLSPEAADIESKLLSSIFVLFTRIYVE